MAYLGLIDSKLGLYIKVNVNHGQNKFEVHISKNVAKMAILWPKIGQRHFCSEASHGQCCTYGLKTTLKLLVHVLAIMASPYLKIVFFQKSGHQTLNIKIHVAHIYRYM